MPASIDHARRSLFAASYIAAFFFSRRHHRHVMSGGRYGERRVQGCLGGVARRLNAPRDNEMTHPRRGAICSLTPASRVSDILGAAGLYRGSWNFGDLPGSSSGARKYTESSEGRLVNGLTSSYDLQTGLYSRN